jgi:hypothetical protein
VYVKLAFVVDAPRDPDVLAPNNIPNSSAFLQDLCSYSLT